MSSFYDDASLVLIPSGYKASKIYSQKPTSGAGDFVATRASNATRVAANGLIEEVRTNFARQSQSFATASAWATTNGTLTNNAGTAPDGTNTASKLVATNTDPFAYQSITLTGPVVASCYFKGVGSSIGKTSELRIGAAVTTFTLTANWQRVSVTSTVAGAANYGVEAPNLSVVVGDEVLLWGFQVEQGDIATNYIPTTTTSVSVGPTNNVPRLDYLNSTCPRLLLEPQRTNLITFSEQFDNAAWFKGNTTVTANNTISPSGYQDADRIVFSTIANANIQRASATATTIGTQYTISFYARADAAVNNVKLSSVGVDTDLAITTTWQRFTRTITANATTTASTLVVRNGVATTIYLWGFQFEAGSYATSYIPSLNSTTTRVGDYASNSLVTTNANWTLLVDTDFVPYSEILNLYFVTSTGRFVSFYQSFDYFRIVGNAGAGVFAGRVMSDTAGRKKVVLQNDGTDCIVFVNGVRLGAINPAGASPLTGTGSAYFTFYGGGSQVATIGKLREFLQFNTKLTDAQCIELTTI